MALTRILELERELEKRAQSLAELTKQNIHLESVIVTLNTQISRLIRDPFSSQSSPRLQADVRPATNVDSTFRISTRTTPTDSSGTNGNNIPVPNPLHTDVNESGSLDGRKIDDSNSREHFNFSSTPPSASCHSSGINAFVPNMSNAASISNPVGFPPNTVNPSFNNPSGINPVTAGVINNVSPESQPVFPPYSGHPYDSRMNQFFPGASPSSQYDPYSYSANFHQASMNPANYMVPPSYPPINPASYAGVPPPFVSGNAPYYRSRYRGTNGGESRRRFFAARKTQYFNF